MFELNDIIKSAVGLSVSQEAQVQEIAQARTQQGALGRQVASSTRRAAELQEEVDLSEGMAKMEAMNSSRRAAIAMGTNMADVSEIITATAAQMRADMLAYQAAELQVQEIEEGSNILGNPIGWARDLLHGDEARATRDATFRRHQNTASMLNNMLALTDANTKTQLSLTAAADADTIKKGAEAKRILAEADANRAEIEALSFDVSGIDALRQHGAAEFQRQALVYNEIVQANRFEAAYEQQVRQLEKQEATDEAYEYVAENVNIPLKAMGLPEVPAGVVRQFYGSNTPEGQMMLELAGLGQMSRNMGGAVVGSSPAHAYYLAQRLGGGLPGNTDPSVLDSMDRASARVEAERAEARTFTTDGQVTELGFTWKNADDTDALYVGFNRAFRADLAAEDARFYAKPLAFGLIHKEYPMNLESKYGQTVVAPLLEAGATNLTLPDLARFTAESYAKGELTSDEASRGLASYGMAQLSLYNATSGRSTFGAPLLGDEASVIPLPSGRVRTTEVLGRAAQAGLGMSLGFPSALGSRQRSVQESTVPVDITSPTDINHYLNRYRTNAVARRMQEVAGGSRTQAQSATGTAAGTTGTQE